MLVTGTYCVLVETGANGPTKRILNFTEIITSKGVEL